MDYETDCKGGRIVNTAPSFNQIICGHSLQVIKTLADQSINCVVTSPPYYGPRDYGMEEQYGLEPTPQEYVNNMVMLFREIRRTLRDDGTVWLNLGDSYNGSGKGSHLGAASSKQATNRGANIDLPLRVKGIKPKNLFGIPWRVALALQDDGWVLRSAVIWNKPNPMPGSQKDRPTSSYEYIFLFSKSSKTLFWAHRDKGLMDGYLNQRRPPKPDYRWVHNDSGKEVAIEPPADDLNQWHRINLWHGFSYWYDIDAVKTPVKPHSIKRLGRAVSATHKMIDGAPGQTPHSMNKPRPNKQDTVGNRQYADFNDRYNGEATPMATLRDVWIIPTASYKGNHFAVFPVEIPRRCIALGCPPGGVVLDPFIGSGTTAEAAITLGRQYLGIELNPLYVDECQKRLARPLQMDLTGIPLFTEGVAS